MSLSTTFNPSGTRNRRLRVLKRSLVPKLAVAISEDIEAGANPDLFERASIRILAKQKTIRAMRDVIPSYIEAGGNINSFQYDILFLIDRRLQGSISDRAYWGRMATDAWRDYEAEQNGT